MSLISRFPFLSCGVASTYFFYQPLLAFLAFLIIMIALFIKKARCARNKVVLSPTATKVKVRVRTECSDVSQVSINYDVRFILH